MTPILGITMGDPAGVGPEIILKAARRQWGQAKFLPLILGDFDFLSRVQKKVFNHSSVQKIQLKALLLNNLNRKDLMAIKWPTLPILDFKNMTSEALGFGHATATGGRASGDYIKRGVELIQTGILDGLVTAPINKEAFRLGGWGNKYVGHTEMLAGLSKSKNVALMLAYKNLRAVHVTSHVALKDVPRLITTKRISETIRLTIDGLRLSGIAEPRIAVAGLNPHAGDHGVMGNEEKKIISPAIQSFRKKGFDVTGPLPADVMWSMVKDGLFDAGIAMYHDQGQIPVKLMSFQRKNNRYETHGVNITLGLPFVRVSVAHGTAYDIAGKGIVSEESLLDAVAIAAQMVRVRMVRG